MSQRWSTRFGARCELQMPIELWNFFVYRFFYRNSFLQEESQYILMFILIQYGEWTLAEVLPLQRLLFHIKVSKKWLLPQPSRFWFRVSGKLILNQTEVKKNQIKITHKPWSTKTRLVKGASLIWFREIIHVPGVIVIHHQTAWSR